MRLLLLEDDMRLAQQLQKLLRASGHEVEHRREGGSLPLTELDAMFDAGIFDVGLPGMDGVEVVKELRVAGVKMPVIFLTARGAVRDRVEALRGGGDDYMVKPFSYEELAVRLEVLCRRSGRSGSPVQFDHIKRTFSDGVRVVDLQPKELSLLSVLAEHPGNVVSKSFLLDRVWGLQFDPGTNVVDAMVCRIRGKLVAAGIASTIETVRGKGYGYRAAS